MSSKKENMSKLLQVLQNKGNNVQGSEEAVETSSLKSKLKKRKKKKKDNMDEKPSIPANTSGSW